MSFLLPFLKKTKSMRSYKNSNTEVLLSLPFIYKSTLSSFLLERSREGTICFKSLTTVYEKKNENNWTFFVYMLVMKSLK